MYRNVYFITKEQNDDTLKKVSDYIKEKYNSEIDKFTDDTIFEDSLSTDDNLFLLYLDDNRIKTFFKNHLHKDIHIGILPNDECVNAIRNYGISKDINIAIDDAFNSELLSKVDLLRCNDSIAFNRIVIGDMHGMNRFDYNQQSRFNKIKIFFENLTNISFKSYTLTTSKDHSIQTAASGITILEHSSITNQESAIKDKLSIHDGKLNAYILAPTSLLSYIWYLVSIFFYQRISLIALPKSLGFIKSSKLCISSDSNLDYKVDNADSFQSKTIVLEVLKDCLHIHLGRVLFEIVKNDENNFEEKDVTKINTLPRGEVNSILIGGKLPLFKKASDDDFKDLLVSLKENAKFSYVYLTLMILITLLATTGLFANSAPVIIGAMILAPLMSPIISLSMGVIRTDRLLLIESAKTLFIGITMALVFSCIYTLFIPLEQITSEMQGRLNPNLLDLMVAVFSGIAGAYANSKEEIAKSLAGVAIAVALVPPLSVTGIGLGLGNIDVIYGSFLLFVTNLVGITLSAALTFIVLGFAPVKKAKKGIFYTAILMALITIPLSLSFSQVVEKYNLFNQLNSINHITYNNEEIEINIKTITNKDKQIIVNLEVISTKPLLLIDYNIIKETLQKTVAKEIVLKIVPVIIIN